MVKGNLVGLVTVFLWSSLTLLAVLIGKFPPFLLIAIALGISSIFGMIHIILNNRFMKVFRQSYKVWLISIFGIFGYHFFYFSALQKAPPETVSLINYTWPFLTVILSSLVNERKVKWFHLCGGLICFIGITPLIIFNQSSVNWINPEYLLGYVFSLVAAVIWSIYSVCTSEFKNTPSEFVAVVCFVTSILSFISHLIFENSFQPSTHQLFFVLMAAIGPLGIAFYSWDYGLKKGDVKLLSLMSYLIPIFSSLLLLFAEIETPKSLLFLSSIIVFVGLTISSYDWVKKIFCRGNLLNQ